MENDRITVKSDIDAMMEEIYEIAKKTIDNGDEKRAGVFHSLHRKISDIYDGMPRQYRQLLDYIQGQIENTEKAARGRSEDFVEEVSIIRREMTNDTEDVKITYEEAEDLMTGVKAQLDELIHKKENARDRQGKERENGHFIQLDEDMTKIVETLKRSMRITDPRRYDEISGALSDLTDMTKELAEGEKATTDKISDDIEDTIQDYSTRLKRKHEVEIDSAGREVIHGEHFDYFVAEVPERGLEGQIIKKGKYVSVEAFIENGDVDFDRDDEKKDRFVKIEGEQFYGYITKAEHNKVIENVRVHSQERQSTENDIDRNPFEGKSAETHPQERKSEKTEKEKSHEEEKSPFDF